MSFRPSNHTHYAGLGSLERSVIGAQTILMHYPPHTSSYGNPVVAAGIQGATALTGMIFGAVGQGQQNKAQQALLAQQAAAAGDLNETNARIAEVTAKTEQLLAQKQMIMVLAGSVVVLSALGFGAYLLKDRE